MPQFKKFSTMPFCQDGILPRWHFRLFFLCLRLNSSNFLKQHFSKMALSSFFLCLRLNSSIFQKRLFPRWHFCAIFLSLSTPRFKQWSKMTSVWKPCFFLCLNSSTVVFNDGIFVKNVFLRPHLDFGSCQRWHFQEIILLYLHLDSSCFQRWHYSEEFSFVYASIQVVFKDGIFYDHGR